VIRDDRIDLPTMRRSARPDARRIPSRPGVVPPLPRLPAPNAGEQLMDSLPKPTPRLSATEFAKTHHKTAAVLSYGVRCSKAKCRCARSAYRHGPYTFLYWRDAQGRPHRRYVPKAEVAAVRTIVTERKHGEREARRQLEQAKAELRLLGKLLKEWDRW
jgi:hypothetical protein